MSFKEDYENNYRNCYRKYYDIQEWANDNVGYITLGVLAGIIVFFDGLAVWKATQGTLAGCIPKDGNAGTALGLAMALSITATLCVMGVGTLHLLWKHVICTVGAWLFNEFPVIFCAFSKTLIGRCPIKKSGFRIRMD